MTEIRKQPGGILPMPTDETTFDTDTQADEGLDSPQSKPTPESSCNKQKKKSKKRSGKGTYLA